MATSERRSQPTRPMPPIPQDPAPKKANPKLAATPPGMASALPPPSCPTRTGNSIFCMRISLTNISPPPPPKKSSSTKWRSTSSLFARAETLLAERLDFNDPEDDSKQVALMMRYQSSADRQFNRNLSDLRKIQKERRLQEIGSVSQPIESGIAEPAGIGSVPQKPAAPPAAPPNFAPKQRFPSPPIRLIQRQRSR